MPSLLAATWMHIKHCTIFVFSTIGRACICTLRKCLPHAPNVCYQTLLRQNQVSWFTISPLKPHFWYCMLTCKWLVPIPVLRDPKLTSLLAAGCALLVPWSLSPGLAPLHLWPPLWKSNFDMAFATPSSWIRTPNYLVYVKKHSTCSRSTAMFYRVTITTPCLSNNYVVISIKG